MEISYFLSIGVYREFLMCQDQGDIGEQHRLVSLEIRDFGRRKISGSLITKQQRNHERRSPALHVEAGGRDEAEETAFAFVHR